MKKLLLIAFALAVGSNVKAQTYSPIAVTGYNADIVANGAGTVLSSTSTDVDGVNYNFVAANFVNPANATPTSALPTSGTITSVVSTTPGLTFQMAPFTGNNSLRISGTGAASLTFPAAVYADQLYILATSGSGASTSTIAVTFSDNTTQVFTQIVSDWYDATGFAIQGISRVNRTNDAIENSTTNPRLYQYMLPISIANLSKTIQSITFNKTTAGGVLNVMGITARTIPSPVTNDAGILAITSPVTPVMQNVSKPVQVTLVNQGTANLTSATLTWTVDGTAQTSYAWTGNLALNQTATVTVGNFTFTPGSHTVSVCATNPNNTTDGFATNDCMLATLNSCNVLAGAYTIDKNSPVSATNFQTLASAVSAMGGCGISAPVTFNVVAASGPYTEQIEIPAISGASATNTITFNGNNNTITADPVSATRAVIKLNGANYVTITNFTIATFGVSTSSYGWGIQFINGADNNTISNNTINIGSLSITESTSSGIVFSNSTTSVITAANNGNNNLITGNTITGGYYGIVVYGLAANTGNNRIVNNTVSDFYAAGIKLVGMNATQVTGNIISRPTRLAVTTFEGITIGAATQNSIISKNRISNTHGGATSLTGTAYGIYANGDDAPVGAENIVKNNLIYNINNTGTAYGLYNSSSDGVYYYHNTINLDNLANTGTVRGFYQTTLASNIRLMNNVINVAGGTTGVKHALYYGTTTSNIRSNTNDLFVTGGASGSGTGYFTSNRLLLADWRTGSGDDSISVSVDPMFTSAVNPYNFLPTNTALNNIGLAVAPIVTDDITGALRNPATPDPGAYEMGIFTPTTSDAGVTAITAPTSGCNLTNQETVTITVNNFGTATLTNIPVSYAINGGTPVAETMAGPLAPNANATYTFTTKADLSVANTYNFVARTNLVGDALTTNDSFTKVVNATATPATPTTTTGGTSATFCAGGSVTITATSTTTGATYQWLLNGAPIAGATSAAYTANAAGSYTAIANSGSCSSAASAATVVIVNPAPATPTITAGGTTTFCTGGSVTLTAASATTGATYQWFNNATAITGATAATYAATTAGSYTVVATTNNCSSAVSTATAVTVNAVAATPTVTAGGATTFCSGNSVVLTAASATSGATYTWFLNGTVITGATSATYTANAAGTYTAVATVNGCPSQASAATTITVNATPATPTITQNGGLLTSSSATGNQWFLNGVAIPGATGSTYVTAANGNYTLVVTTNGCASATSAVKTVTNTGLAEDLAGMQISVYPNPSSGLFNLTLPKNQTYEITVADLTGKVWKQQTLKTKNAQLDLTKTAKGIYLLKVVSEGKTAVRKLIIE